jgi:hypothetical protein
MSRVIDAMSSAKIRARHLERECAGLVAQKAELAQAHHIEALFEKRARAIPSLQTARESGSTFNRR